MEFYGPLEDAFIANTQSFYLDKSRKLMMELNMAKSMTFNDYMNSIHLILANETARVESYLDESSTQKVLKICEECLIKNHQGVFNRAFEDYLVRGDFDKIGQFYDLIQRFPEDLESFKATFKTFIQKEGDSAISKLENVLNVDPPAYVETILDIFGKYERMIKLEMCSSDVFMKALEESSKVFINENAVTLASTYEDRNAELLAKYCDVLMTENSSVEFSENAVEKKLELIWMIFKVLNDKDGFQKFYENITARRLIFDLSVSDELENFMIIKLRDYFGKQDSKALREIVLNKQISADINKEFIASVEREKNQKILKNFTVTVLAERSCEFLSIQRRV